MTNSSEPGSEVLEVRLGATRAEGGTREVSYVIGGERDLPFLGNRPDQLLVALEVCDDPRFSPPVVRDYVGDLANNPDEWARAAERTYGADLVRLNFTSTKQRRFDAFGEIAATMDQVLAATTRPLIVEGSSEPELDSEVFRRCGEAGEGERLLLGTAEADRYRSVAAAALAYGHAVIAQSPIDINLAKQLNILLRETGIPRDRIVIDPYTGALGYGFEYSYSVMERVRLAGLAGDADLAMPMISAPADTLSVREVREAAPADRDAMAVAWEFYTAYSAFVAGASIVCVRHPLSVKKLHEALEV
ncbi:carbon-monoxide dehydrogenase delta subunit [Methanoculleus bourgensis MS2]|uniref:Carbon-monoxide dehydrogenase delta subunit n=1 Tax=Methanoculleus bourgensis (strain ATCC 43281 / DSM 3045 / OCM 15 / MS2) TaxID=1201294 RepID=I7LKT5_METBM|nr:acetyl-CoA decarbonylase/synthase complex subunit delta [Methanoculleus bourgensis]CCJ37297.1 carbon-monoxide dehydrogenase delta subunit [Methanoculleus bourgensis MS2]